MKLRTVENKIGVIMASETNENVKQNKNKGQKKKHMIFRLYS